MRPMVTLGGGKPLPATHSLKEAKKKERGGTREGGSTLLPLN